MFDRWIEKDGLTDTMKDIGAGMIVFSPLAQGLLTDRYLNGIPEDSRAKRNHFLHEDSITEEVLAKVRALNDIASARGQSLADMALAWNLREDKVTSVLIGASRPEQITDGVKFLNKMQFSEDEISKIDRILV